jgi:ComF family protein
VIEQLSARVQRLAEGALDLLFPPRCVGCRRPGSELCPACLAALPRLMGHLCPVCVEPVAEPGLCPRCSARRPAFERVSSAFVYADVVRQAILALKFRGRRGLAPTLAQAAADAIPRPAGGFVVCAVPMHPTREAARGYNHAALLADEFAAVWGLPRLPADALRRVAQTPQQARLTFDERLANVAGAFKAQPAAVARANVLLVDDVCTTGATLDACAAALRTAGASSVVGVTVARTP